MTNQMIAKKIGEMEKEMIKLKKSAYGSMKTPISLRGIIKKTKISEQDIKKAKKSLFKN
ncbi:MAG: hypothetical protein Q8P52_02700 [bacterium]|nr:hypothetical protein [bacterium]